VRDVQKRKRKRKKSLFFFCHSRLMEMLSSGHQFFSSLSLCYYVFALSLTRSRGFSERDN
jgi:hypothetical protein